MAWYSAFKRKAIEIDEQPKSSYDKSIKINKAKINDFMIKAIGGILDQSHARERFSRPEYNLWEIKEASEADSYVKISLSKYSYLIYKAGSSLKGSDEPVSYLEKRFRMMSFATQKPMDILFQEIADDLVKYSNAFLIKKRVDSIPGIKATPVLADKVVGGYFRVDPASIKIKRDKNGNILKYEQGYGDNKREFFPRDVIHMFMDKDANNAFGTPRIIAALEDVKLLRKIEGNVTALIYRFSMPLYQWIVGLPQPGMQATEPEILKAQREVENSTLDGIVITNERTAIKAIGAEGSALNAEGYLKYFEDRVFSALGVSASQMGRGGAKQDSESMEAQIHDTVKYIQRIMAIFIQEKILNELLLEGGYNPILNEEDIVEYEFEEISLETKVKKENHEMLKYQSNLTSINESRRKMGMKDDVDDENKLYKNYIETNARMQEIDRTAEHQKELAKINAQNKPASSGNSSSSSGNKAPRSSKSSGPSKAVSTNNRPQNQHGTHSAKIREGHGIETGEHKKQFKSIFKSYYNASNDIEGGESIDLILPLISEEICTELKREIDSYSLNGVYDAISDINEISDKKILLPNESIVLSSFYDESEEAINNIFKDLKTKLELDENNISTVFNKQEYKLRFLTDYMLRKAY
ncbi:hypothetical protein [Paraclostridium dentum]|uniref:hypothetical protein n=1 Tax=Paraclostridium dentum TaxID=2662455 RepID=UPI003F3E522B